MAVQAIGLGLAAYPVVKEIVTELTNLFIGLSDGEREDWIKGVVERLVNEYPGHNVLVYKSGYFPEGPDDVQVETSTEYADSTFSIAVFGSGKFVRTGEVHPAFQNAEQMFSTGEASALALSCSVMWLGLSTLCATQSCAVSSSSMAFSCQLPVPL